MTLRSEDVIGGLAASVEALKPEPGELLLMRLREDCGPDQARFLMDWVRDNIAKGTPVMLAIPGCDIIAASMAELGMKVWGSDCQECGNATPDSQRCELCRSTAKTKTLWVKA